DDAMYLPQPSQVLCRHTDTSSQWIVGVQCEVLPGKQLIFPDTFDHKEIPVHYRKYTSRLIHPVGLIDLGSNHAGTIHQLGTHTIARHFNHHRLFKKTYRFPVHMKGWDITIMKTVGISFGKS